MSTRGFIAFAAGGPAKVAYVHSDAYPSGLGVDVLNWLRSVPLDDAADDVRALRVVDPQSRPTAEDVERLRGYYDPYVDMTDPETYERRTYATWYQVLRGTMGDPALILDAGVIEDMSGLPYSGGAHYGYLVDFDKRTFEAYRGCQRVAHADGRFALPVANELGYYPARLVGSWPLDALPSNESLATAYRVGDV